MKHLRSAARWVRRSSADIIVLTGIVLCASAGWLVHPSVGLAIAGTGLIWGVRFGGQPGRR